MSKKTTTAIILPIALAGISFTALAKSVTTKRTGTKASVTTWSLTSDSLDNLSTDVDITVSAGVVMELKDFGSSPDIGVSTCHEDGNVDYIGDTAGGSVKEGGNVTTTGNCATGNFSTPTS